MSAEFRREVAQAANSRRVARATCSVRAQERPLAKVEWPIAARAMRLRPVRIDRRCSRVARLHRLERKTAAEYRQARRIAPADSAPLRRLRAARPRVANPIPMPRAAAVRAAAATTGTARRRRRRSSAVTAVMAATRAAWGVDRRIQRVRSSICGSRSRAARRLAHIRAATMATTAEAAARPAPADRVLLRVPAGTRRAVADMRRAAAVDMPAVAAEATPEAAGTAEV